MNIIFTEVEHKPCIIISFQAYIYTELLYICEWL